jgi:manganese efflux pump family protein
VADALKLIALVIPLGLDTLAVSIALGIAGLPADRRTRVASLFAAFETLMPLIGLAIGVPLGNAAGGLADYGAAALLVALGVYLLVERGDDSDARRLASMSTRGLYGAIALGVSISLDELAIGLSAGLLRLPVLPIVIAAGVQAFVVTHVGLLLGSRLGRRWRESAERLAGVALLLLGVIVLAARVAR